ncbi:MAG: hypothetical protein R2771_04640 [Saprospiraceae bacterium]
MDYKVLEKKLSHYNEVLNNTKQYRKDWNDNLKNTIMETLEEIIENSGMDAEIDEHDQFAGLETITLSLGIVESGISEKIDDNIEKPLIRSNGNLLFQQLFNGKISIWINYPFIEGVGEPKQPKMLEIVRPNELKEINILRYFENFIDELTEWEDFDDDKPPVTGIGFNHQSAALKQ